MSTRYMRKVNVLTVAGVMAFVVATQAANLYWDGGTTDIAVNGDGVSAGGTGTWNTAIKNWDNGNGVAHIAWPGGANANVSYFGGTGGTVTFGANLGTSGAYPNTIRVTAGNYVFNQNGYDLSWRGSGLVISSGATLVLTNGTVTLLGSYNWDVTGSSALKVYSKVTGSGGTVNKLGAGNLYLYNDANDFTGMLYGQNGSGILISSIKNSGVASAAGAGSEVQTGYNNSITYIGAGDSTDRKLTLIGSQAF